MTLELPEPLTPPDCDLRDFPYMPLMVSRLRRSRAWLLAKRQPELGFYMVNLWTGSWHELPAASLEDDDDVLADVAMCTTARWPKCRDLVLHGWVKCADGRWYHPVVAEQARETWDHKRKRREAGRIGNAVRWGSQSDAIATPNGLVNGSQNVAREWKGREGKKESLVRRASDDSDFDRFWTIYPRKDAKLDAKKAWVAARKLASAEEIIAGLSAYPFSGEAQFQKLPGGWLRDGRWQEVSTTPPTQPQLTNDWNRY